MKLTRDPKLRVIRTPGAWHRLRDLRTETKAFGSEPPETYTRYVSMRRTIQIARRIRQLQEWTRNCL